MTTPKKVGGYAWNGLLKEALEHNQQAKRLLVRTHEILGRILKEKPDEACLAVLLSEISHGLWGADQALSEEQRVWIELMGISEDG